MEWVDALQGRLIALDTAPLIYFITMIPVVHLGWTAAWYGGARGAFRRFVSQFQRKKFLRISTRKNFFL
jgi:hypothetical protein